jgi:cytochrome b pre-mRNA-processing protein 3
MIFRLFRRSADRELIDRLHGEIMAAARHPALFTAYAINDDVDGRFETVALHAALLLRRLDNMAPPALELAQDLTDALFRSFDIALREAGVGDISVPRRMKTIARAFLGRADAYDRALRNGTPALEAALSRNVYNSRGNPARLARYVEAADQALANASLDVFVVGDIPFPDPLAIP